MPGGTRRLQFAHTSIEKFDFGRYGRSHLQNDTHWVVGGTAGSAGGKKHF